MEAILNTMEAHGNTNHGNKFPAKDSNRHQVTHGSDDIGSHHTRETISITNNTRDDTANDTRDDTAGTTDWDLGEYNYVLSTLAEYRTGGTSSRDEGLFLFPHEFLG